MSPSPPATKLKKHANNDIKAPSKAIKLNRDHLEKPQPGDKIDHSIAASHSNTNAVGNSRPISLKRVKKEKKRYQELVIDGFTITAFRTWEDLQDEINERISESRQNAQHDDIEMPNTSCSNGTTSSLTTSEPNLHSNQSNTPATNSISTPPPPIQQIRQSPSSSGANSDHIAATETQRNHTGRLDDLNSQDHRHHHLGSNTIDHQRNQTMYNFMDQQYHQLYQQMQNSAQQLHNLPPFPSVPHPQNSYFSLIDHPHKAYLKAHLPTAQTPYAPPPMMSMPNPSSMISPPHFNSPYTITNTVISRQTSIIPSAPMPGSLEHLTSRYGRHPYFSAAEQSMTLPTFSQHHPGNYLPSPTERSFMEFARSYATTSPSYASFMNQVAMPKSLMDAPRFSNQIYRMTLDQQPRTMTSFGGGPGPFPGFDPTGRPPISMLPPHYTMWCPSSPSSSS